MLNDELTAINELVAACLSNVLAGYTDSFCEQFNDHANRIKTNWQKAAFSEISDSGLKRYFSYHLEGISKISDTLSKMDTNADSLAQSCNSVILELIDHLIEFYPGYLSSKITVAVAYQLRCFAQQKAAVDLIVTSLQSAGIDLQLKECLVNYLKMIDGPVFDRRLDYSALNYFTQLVERLWGLCSKTSFTEQVLNDLLLELNFNHLGYYGYRQQCYYVATGSMFYPQKVAFFRNELMHLTEQPEQCLYIYHPDWPPLKTMLIQFVKGQLEILNHDDDCWPDEKKYEQHEKIPLNLSVAQLACLIRAMFEEECFGAYNLQDLFKFFAGNFRTKRQGKISGHSLSKEYYSINQVTAATMIDKLKKMQARLNQNFFPALVAISVIIGVY